MYSISPHTKIQIPGFWVKYRVNLSSANHLASKLVRAIFPSRRSLPTNIQYPSTPGLSFLQPLPLPLLRLVLVYSNYIIVDRHCSNTCNNIKREDMGCDLPPRTPTVHNQTKEITSIMWNVGKREATKLDLTG